jgi:predicted NBD/HSP70 family sugar kinase
MYYLGFDIGGTKCAVSLGKWQNQEIELVDRQEVQTRACPKETLQALAPFIMQWKSRFEIQGAGISCGGPLDAKAGEIISTPNLAKSWHGFKIVDYIKSNFGVQAKLENDANASAVAEWKFGAGKGTENLVFLTFGTGLGAGLILNGKLYSGANGNAGEIGHIRLEEQGPIGYNKAGSAEGIVYSTKPLSYMGELIENFSLRFENGKVTEVKAEKGEELLKQMVTMDEGAGMLGEVALIPYESPISKSGVLFYNTLFDENASCHLALGRGFNECLKGFENFDSEECKRRGINESMIHVDFMIGAKDTEIVGFKSNGERVQIFKDGNWAF